MSEGIAERDTCDAGRSAFFGGRWKLPCPYRGGVFHLIGAPGASKAIQLCPRHFKQANEAGLVTEPYIGREEMERRMRS